MDLNSVKIKIEQLHTRYLLENTGLETHPFYARNFKPDLIGSSRHTFELKTRNFPHIQTNIRKKNRSQFGWWSLDLQQILNYERYREKTNTDLFWIFMLGETEKELTLSLDLDEDLILKRTLYVCPWNIYHSTKISQGFFYNLNSSRLFHNRDYFVKTEGKNSFYFESSLPTSVLKLFNIN